jgi:hypothetical protein
MVLVGAILMNHHEVSVCIRGETSPDAGSNPAPSPLNVLNGSVQIGEAPLILSRDRHK